MMWLIAGCAMLLQAILDSLLEEHGELSLEHLRQLPSDDIKQQLGKYKGVGPKSIACESNAGCCYTQAAFVSCLKGVCLLVYRTAALRHHREAQQVNTSYICPEMPAASQDPNPPPLGHTLRQRPDDDNDLAPENNAGNPVVV